MAFMEEVGVCDLNGSVDKYVCCLTEKLSSFPSALEANDIEDFCSLAQYYASKTPQSFRQVRQFPFPYLDCICQFPGWFTNHMPSMFHNSGTVWIWESY